MVAVTIPDGVTAGARFQATTPDGPMTITVPDWAGPGQQIEIPCNSAADGSVTVDEKACDEFDAILSKASKLTFDPFYRGITSAYTPAFFDADGKQLFHINIAAPDALTAAWPLGPYAYRATLRLPDGREVLTVTNAGKPLTGCMNQTTGLQGRAPPAQVMDRGDASTIAGDGCPHCCWQHLKIMSSDYTVTRSVAGAKNVKLTSELPQNQPAFIFECVAQIAFLMTGGVSACIHPCILRRPDFYQEVVSVGGEGGISDLTPLGARLVVKNKMCHEAGLCDSLCKVAQPCILAEATIVFDDAAPLQARKDLIAIVAFKSGAYMTHNQGHGGW